MELSFFDFHSDTASELFRQKKSLASNDLHVSLENASVYKRYGQVFAVFTSSRLNDEEGWQAFLKISDFFRTELADHGDRIGFATDAGDLDRLWNSDRYAAFLAVEDARLLAKDPERLQTLYSRGVRFLTLTWAGETCIGGSWDTQSGLTDFGKRVVADCFRYGIVPDISHASEKTIDDALTLAFDARKPIIATHSNAHAVYGHNRNLRDRHFESIRDLGGVVGMNMYRSHLSDHAVSPATPETVFSHIDHFMSLGGENTVVFGSDFDGATFPDALKNLASIADIAEVLLRHNYSEGLIRKIFWENAVAFLRRTLPETNL